MTIIIVYFRTDAKENLKRLLKMLPAGGLAINSYCFRAWFYLMCNYAFQMHNCTSILQPGSPWQVMMEHKTRPFRSLTQRKYLYIILPAFVGSVIASVLTGSFHGAHLFFSCSLAAAGFLMFTLRENPASR